MAERQAQWTSSAPTRKTDGRASLFVCVCVSVSACLSLFCPCLVYSALIDSNPLARQFLREIEIQQKRSARVPLSASR